MNMSKVHQNPLWENFFVRIFHSSILSITINRKSYHNFHQFFWLRIVNIHLQNTASNRTWRESVYTSALSATTLTSNLEQLSQEHTIFSKESVGTH